MNIIELAKKWGYWDGNTAEFNDVGLEMFAKAIKQHLDYDSLHTCHNECPRPACVHMRKVVQAEREACAQVCDEAELRFAGLWDNFAYPWDKGAADASNQIAAAIRARGEK